MAKASPKPRPMKSRRNGLKHARRIQSNHTVIKMAERAVLGLK